MNKAKPCKSDTLKLAKTLKNLIREGCELAIIVDSLWQVYFAENVDKSAGSTSRFQ